jgi:hypothetical protein
LLLHSSGDSRSSWPRCRPTASSASKPSDRDLPGSYDHARRKRVEEKMQVLRWNERSHCRMILHVGSHTAAQLHSPTARNSAFALWFHSARRLIAEWREVRSSWRCHAWGQSESYKVCSAGSWRHRRPANDQPLTWAWSTRHPGFCRTKENPSPDSDHLDLDLSPIWKVWCDGPPLANAVRPMPCAQKVNLKACCPCDKRSSDDRHDRREIGSAGVRKCDSGTKQLWHRYIIPSPKGLAWQDVRPLNVKRWQLTRAWRNHFTYSSKFKAIDCSELPHAHHNWQRYILRIFSSRFYAMWLFKSGCLVNKIEGSWADDLPLNLCM